VNARLPSGVLVGALIRRANHEGGIATVLVRGDQDAGAILVVTLDRGTNPKVWERGLGPDGKPRLLPVGPQDLVPEAEVTAYWQRRRSRDADLWVVELDIVSAERFAAETIAAG